MAALTLTVSSADASFGRKYINLVLSDIYFGYSAAFVSPSTPNWLVKSLGELPVTDIRTASFT